MIPILWWSLTMAAPGPPPSPVPMQSAPSTTDTLILESRVDVYDPASGAFMGRETTRYDAAGRRLGVRTVDAVGAPQPETKPDSARLDYRYQLHDEWGNWIRRVGGRDGLAQRHDVRTIVYRGQASPTAPQPVPFKWTMISRETSNEVSPAFSRDGRRMVFARYGEDPGRKRPFVADRTDAGWEVRPLGVVPQVYDLSISPDGETIYFTTRDENRARLIETFRTRRIRGSWSEPENLTREYGVRGTSISQSEAGDLMLFDATGTSGAGLYLARASGDGFSEAARLGAEVHGEGLVPFDGSIHPEGDRVIYTLRTDGARESGDENGFWVASLEDGQLGAPWKIGVLTHGRSGRVVEALGLFVFTDGEDILSVPLIDVDLESPRR